MRIRFQIQLINFGSECGSGSEFLLDADSEPDADVDPDTDPDADPSYQNYVYPVHNTTIVDVSHLSFSFLCLMLL
jgi:hypothetical protein